MTAVYLVRHGQASFGQADYDVLSPTGERQSRILGGELRRRDLKIDQVWSGTLRRQQATAAACLPAAAIDAECRPDPRWNEYDLEPLMQHHLAALSEELLVATASPREFQRLLEKAIVAWSEDGAPIGSAGTWREFCDSGSSALAELFTSLGRGGMGLVFTSGGVISAICANLLGLPPEGFLAINRVLANAGVTKVVHGRSGTSLVSLNDHGHFEGVNRELLSYR